MNKNAATVDSGARNAIVDAAARKVADAAVIYFDFDGSCAELDAEAFCALDDAVREYRTLTESQEVELDV